MRDCMVDDEAAVLPEGEELRELGSYGIMRGNIMISRMLALPPFSQAGTGA